MREGQKGTRITSIHRACRLNRVSDVICTLRNKSSNNNNINTVLFNRTPLQIVVENNNYDIACLLMHDKRINTNVKTYNYDTESYNETAFSLAVKLNNVKIAHLLLNTNLPFDSNITTFEQLVNQHPLHITKYHLDILFHYACKHDDKNITCALLHHFTSILET